MIQHIRVAIRLPARITENGERHAQPLVLHGLEPKSNCHVFLWELSQPRQGRVLHAASAFVLSALVLREQAYVVAQISCQEIATTGSVDRIGVLARELAEHLIAVLGTGVGLGLATAADLSSVDSTPGKQAVALCEVNQAVEEYPGVSVSFQQQVEAVVCHRIPDPLTNFVRKMIIVTAAPSQNRDILLGSLVGCLVTQQEQVLHRAVALAPGTLVCFGVNVQCPRLSDSIHALLVPLCAGWDDNEQIIVLSLLPAKQSRPVCSRRAVAVAGSGAVDGHLDQSCLYGSTKGALCKEAPKAIPLE
mmetsp:Transcript_59433/g.141758  ORF Transcript_59433/g.141758 Transcript_59433/m.141758 type:complete len:304 (-) Transcript_59433:47-958(-)